jgi:AraC-like DNA-binding protein
MPTASLARSRSKYVPACSLKTGIQWPRVDGFTAAPVVVALPASRPEDHAQQEAVLRVGACLAYMMQHLHEAIDMSTLASVAGLSHTNFFALFKRATGHSPNSFLIRARLKRACELLKLTTFRVKEVADLVGYEDPFYFSRAFKAAHGVAPRHYRLALSEPMPAPLRAPQARAPRAAR